MSRSVPRSRPEEKSRPEESSGEEGAVPVIEVPGTPDLGRLQSEEPAPADLEGLGLGRIAGGELGRTEGVIGRTLGLTPRDGLGAIEGRDP